ncbi:MAG: hypothetical protein WCW17_03810 [Patescibacteria group bacterium]
MEIEEKKENNETKKEYLYSRQNFRMILILFLIFLVLGIVFIIGIASIVRHEKKNHEDFGSAGRSMMIQNNGKISRNFNRQNKMGHNFEKTNITGQITGINGNNITVKNSDGTENTVIVSETTSYIKSGEIAKQSDMQVNFVISATGSPNSQGQIAATAIQIW